MYINLSFTRLSKPLKLLLLVISSQVMLVNAQGAQSSNDEDVKVMLATDLQDKYYRQALYHYFQGEPDKALSQVGQSKARLNTLDSRAALFEAGLQLSAGLLQQAKATLVNFDDLLESEKLNGQERTEPENSRVTKANELRLIALLSLTNQYLAKGNSIEAKHTLAKIDSVPELYYQEYHVLNQLAYWPEKNDDLLANPEGSGNESSAYIQLNEALRLIELAQYDLAINALNAIKIKQWHENEANFWQTLFIDAALFSSQKQQQQMAAKQGQAVQDYAKLLLAQIYVSQARYNLAFSELKSFPEQSPYAESALFLFAFASQQVEQHTIAANLLNLLYKNYPYSQLGWQSAELMAQQVSEQRSLAHGVNAYQVVESFFIQRQQELGKFSVAFNKNVNLVNFSPASSLNQANSVDKSDYPAQSVWLQQALFDAELASLYQGLNGIDEQTAKVQLLLEQTVWIAQIISLNQARKKKVIAAQAAREQQGVFSQLKKERARLATLLNRQLANEQAAAFANAQQRQWLKRIQRGHNALQEIGDKKNTVDYKERLARVTGVLSWQLAQQYPARSWAQTKQLQQLDSAIAGVTKQQQNIVKISNTQGSLTPSINKHSQSVAQLNLLLMQLAQLREKISVNIRQKVNIYIDAQHVVLAEHLLSTRQSMANVLERMAIADKRLSQKLSQVSYSQLKRDELSSSEKAPAMAGAY